MLEGMIVKLHTRSLAALVNTRGGKKFNRLKVINFDSVVYKKIIWLYPYTEKKGGYLLM